MDQKHAMLYPPIEPNATNTMPHDQRISASAAIGLPTEAPPSYDVAMNSTGATTRPQGNQSGLGWSTTTTSASATTKPNASAPSPEPRSHTFPHHEPTRPAAIIVEQPMQQPSYIPQQLPQHHQQHNQPLPALSSSNTTAETPKLGPNPSAVRCPACGAIKTTHMIYTPNTRTHLCALLLCLIGWCCCACCVPYCMNSCRTGNHYCGKCNAFLGTFNPHQGSRWI